MKPLHCTAIFLTHKKTASPVSRLAAGLLRKSRGIQASQQSRQWVWLAAAAACTTRFVFMVCILAKPSPKVNLHAKIS